MLSEMLVLDVTDKVLVDLEVRYSYVQSGAEHFFCVILKSER